MSGGPIGEHLGYRTDGVEEYPRPNPKRSHSNEQKSGQPLPTVLGLAVELRNRPHVVTGVVDHCGHDPECHLVTQKNEYEQPDRQGVMQQVLMKLSAAEDHQLAEIEELDSQLEH